VAIIDDADSLNVEGANALLKTLEEPPLDSVIVLIGTSAEKQLSTIRSRSQVVAFRPLDPQVVARLLLAEEAVESLETAQKLARYSDGSLGRARALADPELWQFRAELLQELAKSPFDSVSLAKKTLAFIDAAGREAPPRRERARQLVAFAAELYRQLVRQRSGCDAAADPDLAKAVSRLVQTGWSDDEGVAAVERSLEAIAHIDRNVHQATAIECWLDDLARLDDRVRKGSSVQLSK
jgi:DNA polymerase-3 subunit delta'